MIVVAVALAFLSATCCWYISEKYRLVENLRDAYTALDECKDIMSRQREQVDGYSQLIALQDELIQKLKEAEKHD